MYFQIVTVAHSLERPQEELGDVALSPVFRRVSARCPVLHLFGYVHIPLRDVSRRAPSLVIPGGSAEGGGGGHRWENDQAPLATLLEPGTGGATPNAATTPPPPPPARRPALSSSPADASAQAGPTLSSPSPKLTFRSVRVVEPTEKHGESAALPRPDTGPPTPVHQNSESKETLRSSELLRSRYTQRRACLHIHGVYPSLLLPQYDRNVSAEQLAAQLETVAVRVLSKQGIIIPGQQLVHDVRIVHRYNVYGYRPHAYAFYCVELIDPTIQPKIIDILQNTREVGGRQWQLYDAHMKYHTQFMVHWRVNGVAPFALPVQNCHVRLPTTVELRRSSTPSSSSASSLPSEKGTRAPVEPQDERVSNPHRVHSSTVSDNPTYTGPAFLRFWKSDELGRLTTAEVEMDISARDLREFGDDGHGDDDEKPETSDEVEGEGLLSKAAKAGLKRHDGVPRRKVSAGDNLSYTRRSIRRYFREHGIADGLRVADTIAMERHLQEKASSVQGTGSRTSAAALALLRYGSVTQIQRADPTVRWMRHRMLEYLVERRTVAAAAGEPQQWKKEDEDKADGGDRSGGLMIGSASSPPISTAGASPLPPTIPFTGSAPQMSAEAQLEQRAIRARMVAAYTMPSRGGRGRGRGRGRTRSSSESHVALPEPLPTFAEMIDRAKIPKVGWESGLVMSEAERVGGDACYIGFSSDSLQLSPSQTASGQLSAPSLNTSSNVKEEEEEGEGVAALATLIPSWLGGMSAEGVREAEVSSTQDLMAALVARSSVSLSAVSERRTSTVELPPEVEDEQADEEEKEEGKGSTDSLYSASALSSAQLAECPAIALEAAAPPALADEAKVNPDAARQASSSWSSWSSWSSDSSERATGERARVGDPSNNARHTEQPAEASDAPPRANLAETQRPFQDEHSTSAVRDVAENALLSVKSEKTFSEDEGPPPRDGLTQHLRRLPAVSAQKVADRLSEERSCGAVDPLQRPPFHTHAAVGCVLRNSSRGEEREKRLGHDGDGDATRKRLRFSSQMGVGAAHTSSSEMRAVGACIAFVRVHRTASSRQTSLLSYPQRNSPEATVCEVLAVARLARVGVDTVDLQWFLTLGETHLASDEATLVRRGAWVRPPRVVNVPLTSSAEGADTEASCVRLGELLLGDAVDTVPARVVADVSHAALASAAACSAPTQRLLREPHEFTGTTSVKGDSWSPHNAVQGEADEGVGEEGGSSVCVWPVDCCVEASTYAYHCQKGSERRPSRYNGYVQSQQPHVRVLCRYQYAIKARVLTAATADLFYPRGSVLQAASSADRGSQGLPERETCAQTPRRTSTRARSTRAVFTQPERLSLQDDAEEAPSVHASSTNSPLLSGASVPSVSDTDRVDGDGVREKGAQQEHQPITESGISGEEDDGEDTVLFPSDSSSRSHSSLGEGVQGKEEDDEERATQKVRVELLGPSAVSSSSLSLSQQRSRFSHLLPSAEDGSPASSPLSELSLPIYRVSTDQIPVHSFNIGSVHVERSVCLATRDAATQLHSQEQQRRCHHSAVLACEDEDGGRVYGEAEEPTGSYLPGGHVEVKAWRTELGDAPPLLAGGDSASWDQCSPRLASSTAVHNGERVPVRAERGVRVELLSASSPPELHSVRDSADVMCVASSHGTSPSSSLASSSSPSSVHSVAASEASSVEAVGVVTASQRHFLQLFQRAGTSEEATCTQAMVLQSGGAVGPALDGLPRLFSLTARSGIDAGDGEAQRRCRRAPVSSAVAPLPSRSPPRGAGADVRVRVSAVTWPYMAAIPSAPGNAASVQQPHYEHVERPTGPPSVSDHGPPRESTVDKASPTGPSPQNGKAPPIRERRSASHIPGLSLSVTQQPQHYLQCVLRVQYIEVLMNRRPGETLVSTSDVLAVGLGQATTSVGSPVAVRIFCVAPAQKAAKRSPAGGNGAAEPADASLQHSELHLSSLCSPVQIVTVQDEAALLTRVREEILSYDPDVLLSWEGYKYGLGYLALRYRAVLQRSLAADLSRILQHHGYRKQKASASSSHRPFARAEGPQRDPRTTSEHSGSESLVAHKNTHDPLEHAATNAVGTSHSKEHVGGSADGVSAGSASKPTTPLPPAPQLISSASSVSSEVLDDFEIEGEGEDGGDAVEQLADDDDDEEGVGGRHAGFRNLNASSNRNGGGNGAANMAGWRSTIAAARQKHQPPPQQRRAFGQAGAATSTGAATKMSESAEAVASYSKRFGANVHITGRICTSLGKDLRKDVKMPSYALPMVHKELFGQPLPYFTDAYLALLFHSTADPGERQAALRYLAARVAAPHRVACALHWFTKLLEFSRMYGILTEEVLTRGSQFRVEATLLRLAHPLRYAMLSPSLAQVHRQPRIECIPLVMQPRADLYRKDDPIVVLDFRSLYPSIVIAYNLCYTTCLGMVQPTTHGRLGVLTDFAQRDSLLAALLPDDGAQHDSVVFTPNGAMFVAPSTRVGLLPRMIQAVLDTRFEVQASLKHIAIPTGDTTMQQRLQEQQLALKMLANVTYGYTAASFTGRMPCVDLAEAIVSLGRQTLERAVALIHSTPAWQAEVVYGDTDSLFVRLHGRTLQEAFVVGQQMADAVTQSNPSPIRLQFEKVLSPCLLLVKKRYAGYMWTSPTQTVPTFLAKGIEVVRRDQCPATVHIAQRMLRLLFDGCPAATLKEVYHAEMAKMQAGAVNPFLCIFRRAVKLGRYEHSGDGHLPLAARLALKEMERDVTETPYWGELLPYVVVKSTHSIDNLTDQVLHPAQLLFLTDTHRLDASYYITRNINSSLDRMFYLVGISFAQWYASMPRRRTAHAALLNLPTFMKAQGKLHQRDGQSSRPALASASRPPLQPLQCKGDDGDVADGAAQRARVLRAELLAGHMQRLLDEAADPLFFSRNRDSRFATEEVISDDNDDTSNDGRRKQGAARKHSRGHLSASDAPSPCDVEDLTRPTVHEFVDVEQLMATQRGRLSSAADRPGRMSSFRAPIRRRRGSGAQQSRGNVTLDTFYPRTLCIVCEREAVSLDDVRRQRQVLQSFDSTLRGTIADSGDDEPEHKGDGEGDEAASALLLLPPVCTRCWSDPPSLILHVQERCRAFGQQLHTLHAICASCIGSGGDWGPAAQARYTTALADMEDMDAFSSVSTERRQGAAAAQMGAVGSVPRHLLTAVQLSSTGVPHGCVSIDCAVGFEKKWVTEQWQQWQAVQRFLRVAM